MSGTPRTMIQAIKNGSVAYFEGNVAIGHAGSVNAHVEDFLAQKFGAAVLDARDDDKALLMLDTLWAAITAKAESEDPYRNKFRCMKCQVVLSKHAIRMRRYLRTSCAVCPACAVNLPKPTERR